MRVAYHTLILLLLFLSGSAGAQSPMLTLSEGGKECVGDIAVSPNGRMVAAVTEGAVAEDYVRLWHLPSGEKGHRLSFPVSRVAWSARFSPDGTLLAVSGGNWTGGKGIVAVFDVVTGKKKHEFTNGTDFVSNVVFFSNSRIVGGSYGGFVVLWDIPSAAEVKRFKAHEGNCICLAGALGGKAIATVGSDRTANVWEPDTGRRLASFGPLDGSVGSVALSPDGRVLATLSRSVDESLRLWNVATGRITAVKDFGARRSFPGLLTRWEVFAFDLRI